MPKYDPVLEKAIKALDEWSKTITVDEFIKQHKDMGLIRTPEEDERIEKCDHDWAYFYGQEACRKCTVLKWGKYKDYDL